MRLGRAEKPPKEATFDLTNLIDVLLLLIVFFMMTSQFTRTQQMPVDLPREQGEPGHKASASSVFLDLDAEGRLYALGRPIEIEGLRAALGSASEQPGGAVSSLDVVVRADRSCPAAHLNRLAEALANLGVRNWKLATSPSGTRRGGAAGGRG